VANLQANKRINLNSEYQSPISISNKSDKIKLKIIGSLKEVNDDLINENRNRLLTLSATDSMFATQKLRKSHNHHNRLNKNNNNNNNNNIYHDQTNPKLHSKSLNRIHNNQDINSLSLNSRSSNNLVKRGMTTNIRRQNYSQSQSRSLENTFDHINSSEDDQPQIQFSQEIMEAADKVTYITNHIKSENYYEEVILDLK